MDKFSITLVLLRLKNHRVSYINTLKYIITLHIETKLLVLNYELDAKFNCVGLCCKEFLNPLKTFILQFVYFKPQEDLRNKSAFNHINLFQTLYPAARTIIITI